MKSIFVPVARELILRRLSRLDDTSRARWGSLSLSGMLSHLADSIRMMRGELAVKPKRLPIRFFPLKQLIIYLLPFPKGAPTAPELIRAEPGEWLANAAELRAQLEALGNDTRTTWPEHPAFGRLSRAAVGVLVYRHVDHHLRQFGV